jgi:hypothetical protein
LHRGLLIGITPVQPGDSGPRLRIRFAGPSDPRCRSLDPLVGRQRYGPSS